jgi:2-keto-4-pentenoate hydratase/2-oxohepta-3-ene-1,7-dioic acid hydratase in catechol pathway
LPALPCARYWLDGAQQRRVRHRVQDGVGAKPTPPVWTKAGDVLEIEISNIGTLRNKIVDEK